MVIYLKNNYIKEVLITQTPIGARQLSYFIKTFYGGADFRVVKWWGILQS
jgi:hypothetical protein